MGYPLGAFHRVLSFAAGFSTVPFASMASRHRGQMPFLSRTIAPFQPARSPGPRTVGKTAGLPTPWAVRPFAQTEEICLQALCRRLLPTSYPPWLREEPCHVRRMRLGSSPRSLGSLDRTAVFDEFKHRFQRDRSEGWNPGREASRNARIALRTRGSRNGLGAGTGTQKARGGQATSSPCAAMDTVGGSFATHVSCLLHFLSLASLRNWTMCAASIATPIPSCFADLFHVAKTAHPSFGEKKLPEKKLLLGFDLVGRGDGIPRAVRFLSKGIPFGLDGVVEPGRTEWKRRRTGS